jgi:hypothetical protein
VAPRHYYYNTPKQYLLRYSFGCIASFMFCHL